METLNAATSNALEVTSATLSSLVGSSSGGDTYARRNTVVESISLEQLESLEEVVPLDPDVSTSLPNFSSSGTTNDRKTSKDFRDHKLNGIIWHIVIVADDFSHPKHVLSNGELKPRRPFPQIRSSDFFKKLDERVDDEGNPIWIFPGDSEGLNGWPGLNYELEVISITGKVQSRISPVRYVKRFWDKVAQNREALANKSNRITRTRPCFPHGLHTVRATVMGPEWALKGFSEANPGLVFWSTTNISPRMNLPPPRPPTPLEGHPPSVPGASLGGWTAKAFPRLGNMPDGAAASCLYGTQILQAIKDGSMYPGTGPNPEMHMTSVTHYAHRYAVEHESAKDKITYHAGCLVHWDHHRFSTIVELAWVFGVGGYAGKANWFHDRDIAGGTSLSKVIPPEMIAPWDNHRSEIRCYDVPFVDADDLTEYFKRYTGVKERFLVPVIVGTAPVRITHRSQADLAQYILNYVGNYGAYHEESRNCQTFAADLYGFLAGKKNIVPYSKVLRVLFKPRPYHFLYDPKKKAEMESDEAAGAADLDHSN